MNAPAPAGAGAVGMRLLDKAAVMDRALEAVWKGLLLPQDLGIVWYLCTNLDTTAAGGAGSGTTIQTGECIPRYQTIADECGVSRRTVLRCMKRLRTAGVIQSAAHAGREAGS